MSLYPFEKHPADTGSMSASATTLQQKANGCLDQKEITDKAYNPAVDSWDGICAPELRKAPKPVRDGAEDANKQLAWSAVPIHYAIGKIKSFNTVAAQCQTASEKPDPKGTEVDTPTDTHYGRASLRYSQAYQTYIVDGFQEAAGMFKDGPTEDNIKLARSAGAIPNAPVFHVFGQLWHEDNMRQAVADAKKLIQQISDGKYTDMKTPLGPLVELLKKYGTDQMFAAMLMRQIGPDGLLRLNQIVAQSESDDKPQPGYSKEFQDPALAGLIASFQKNMSITLGTSTGGEDGYDPGTRDEYRLPSDFTERLMELGKQQHDITWPGDDDYHYGAKLYGYQVLAPLLSTGHFSSEFLTPVANDMYYFDRYHGDGNGSVWTDTTVDLRGDHGIRLDWTHGTGSEHSAGFDPLQTLMTSLGHNRDAAHDFFTDERTYDDQHPDGYNDKLHYLLNERQWNLPNDQPWRGDGTDSGGYYDKHRWEEQNNTHAMDPLGAALTAATSEHDQASATLFGDVVHEVAHGDDNRYTDLRDDFANMATQHIGAINSRFIGDGGPSANGDVDPITPGIQYDPGFGSKDTVDLEKFLAETGRDDGAKSHLTAAEGVYMQAAYHHYMDLPGSLQDRANLVNADVNTPLGHVLGALDYGSSKETFDQHQEQDKEHNDAVDQKYGIIGFFTDKLPFDKIPVVGDLTKDGVDGYLDALKESEHVDTTDVANALIGSLHSGSENHVQSTAETTLLASMSDHDKAQFGDALPRDGHGGYKPLSEWTPDDVAHYNTALRNDPHLGALMTNFGQDARGAYAQAFDDAKHDLDEH